MELRTGVARDSDDFVLVVVLVVVLVDYNEELQERFGWKVLIYLLCHLLTLAYVVPVMIWRCRTVDDLVLYDICR